MRRNNLNRIVLCGVIAALISVSLVACQTGVNTDRNQVVQNSVQETQNVTNPAVQNSGSNEQISATNQAVKDPARETQTTTSQAVKNPVDEAQALANQMSKSLLPEAQTFAHSDSKNRGVSLLNAINRERTAEGDDTWVYFFSNLGEKGLYKMKHDGSRKQLLYACDSCRSINIYKGWVYFVSDVIYKIKTDGTELTPLTDEPALSIQVAGDKAYYQNEGQGPEIKKMKLDGSGRKIIDISNQFDFVATSKEIFYTSHESANIGRTPLPHYHASLHKVIQNSDEDIRLSEKLVLSFCITKNMIFYEYAYDDNILRKMNWNGKDEVPVFDGEGGDYRITPPFCISGETIFYASGAQLFRIDITGENKKLISNDFLGASEQHLQYINMVGNWIYYYSAKDNGTCRISLDGSVTQRI